MAAAKHELQQGACTHRLEIGLTAVSMRATVPVPGTRRCLISNYLLKVILFNNTKIRKHNCSQIINEYESLKTNTVIVKIIIISTR